MQAPLGYKREPRHAFRTEKETRELTSERQGIGCSCAGTNSSEKLSRLSVSLVSACREAAVIIVQLSAAWCVARVAVDGLNRDATIYSSAMFNLRGRTVPAASGWAKTSLRRGVGGNYPCGLVCLQGNRRTGSSTTTQPKRRLHVRNATIRLSQGAQMRWSDRRASARVFFRRPIRLHLRSERQQDKHLSLRLDAN